MVHIHNAYPVPPFTSAQLETLTAICDTLFQAHSGEEAAAIKARLPKDCPEWQREKVDTFITRSYSQLPGSIDALVRLMGRAMSAELLAELSAGLSILSHTAGSFVLTGGYTTTFNKLPVGVRESILQSWGTSSLAPRRTLVRAIASLGMLSLYLSDPTVIEAVGYPSPDRRLLTRPLTSPKFTYDFITPPTSTKGSELTVINTQVLIIGSGAGGGVVASRLAPGHETLVIDKGVYAPTGMKHRGQSEALEEMYQNGGFFASESGTISILAGSVFGGGTAINWSGSLKTQHYVREEWAKKKGLGWFLSKGYSHALDAVCDRMGVSTEYITQSKSNGKLLAGSRQLGYHADPIPQNTSGKAHACGFCPYGEKQGTVETFMVDAAKCGAKFLVGAQVDRLLFCRPDEQAPTVVSHSQLHTFYPDTHRSKCFGALLTLQDTTKAVVLASKSVVVSAGSVNTPAILLRSKIRNPNIGRNLHLHPCTYVTAYFDEQINPWEGAIMTAVSNVCENRDGTHHGAKLEVCMSFPGGAAAGPQVWESSLEHKSRMLEYNHSMTLITLVRDRDSGSVIIDAGGHPRIKYDVSVYDAASAMRAVKAGAETMLAAGARRITTTQAGVPSYVPETGHKGLIDPKWLEWIAKVEMAGTKPGWTTYASAHQMGTCAMGVSKNTSVVNPRGAVWGTDNLYVADASVFPSASGVNPMVTTMACAYSIAGFLLEDLAGGGTENGNVQARL